MRAVALSLALAAAPAIAGPPGDAAEPEGAAPAVAPAPVAPKLIAPTPVQPTPVAPSPSRSAPASAARAAPAKAPASLISPPPAQPAATQGEGTRCPPSQSAPPTQSVIEKLGQGDRSLLAGDYRAALFAYQDAVYMAPQNAAARVKLGRAYLALRYPTQAIAQAEEVLAVEPDNEEARRLIQDARNPPARPAATAPAVAQPGQSALRPAAAEDAPAVQPRVYRFALEPEGATPSQEEGGAARAGPAADQGGVAAPAPANQADNSASVAQAGAGPTRRGDADPGAPAAAPTPGQRYRTALGLLSKREFHEAISELSEAIAASPRLAVAYAARGSAQFGLGRYREAAEDYRAALAIDGNLATPLYGLAECFRVLGDSKASAQMYQRYADSRASDARDDLRAIAAKRAQELR